MFLKNIFGKKKEEAEVQLPQSDKSGVAAAVSKLFDKNEKEVAKLRPLVEKIASLGPELKALSDDELKARSQGLRDRFREEVTTRLQKLKNPATGEAYDWQELETELSWSDDYARQRLAIEKEVLDLLLPDAFALVREAGDRTIGLRHFDVQMIGGAVLHSGRIAEMRTGEGKTLVATLPTYLNSLSGRGVHVITVNDYLAERDANWMRPIYEFLGLTVAFLTNDMDPQQRIPAYRCDVLYATNSEVGFDYLRDNMARSPEEIVQRPLNFAMVDEVDNILIDEARTPLIISAQVAKTDRALRRQQMAKTCDGLGRKLMPAVTDAEIDNLLDSVSHKGRVNIDALMQDILRRGAFTEATAYLVDAYLSAEKSARVENAARLLDVADEFVQAGLIDEAGRAQLEAPAINAVKPAALLETWQKEAERLAQPFAHAYANAIVHLDAPNLPERLTIDLALDDDVAATLPDTLQGYEDKAHAVADIVAGEIARRGLIAEDAVQAVGDAMLLVPVPEVAEETPRHGEPVEAAHDRYIFKLVAALSEGVQPALTAAILDAPGGVAEANGILSDIAATADKPVDAGRVRSIVDALEKISLHGLLPYEAAEKLWQNVRLPQGRDGLRKELAGAIQAHPGATAQKIKQLVETYAGERTAFLGGQADALRGKLSDLAGADAIVQRARSGENIESLRRLLQNEVTKNGALADAMKAVRAFVADERRQIDEIAQNLTTEMQEWVEVPRDARKAIAALLAEGGTAEQLRERVLLAVRDLPGENTELPALVGEAVRQLQSWRDEQAVTLIEKIGAGVRLPAEASQAIQTAIEDGEQPGTLEHFAAEHLLSAPEVAPLSEALEEFGTNWEEFRAAQNARLLDSIGATLDLSADAADSIADVLNKPLSGALDAALFAEIARDAVSRHLEPLLAEENAEAFVEEVKRRIPLAKEVQNKLKPADFSHRSAEQLQRSLVRLVERSLEVMPFEDYKRLIRNLGWFTEKDEKRRQAALTDMGTLIAEREAGTPAFTDPENFLDALIGSEILTHDEAAIVQSAHAETPESTLSAVIDRVLQLPAERRRRLSEAKLQEVQSVLDQAIRAHALFQREVHYVIGTNPETGKQEIVIVDEFTGRKMPGRRFSEGLHEALEAKHGLEVQLESQTVATITIQNYFRLYNKLGGMTGTAKTEEQEFAKTYGIEVVSIPTNRSIQRKDYPDVVYKTAEAKMRAVTFEILEHHCSAQPVLVGTRSVEVSERMSERLKPQALQALVLAHLIKSKLWDDKSVPEEQKQQIYQALRTPVAQINLMQMKALAKQVGLQPDAIHEENVNKLLSLFTVSNPSRERLITALRVGLPHNVLNAKNHRNEARIVAEAARPSAVTIATNMAGRGVDIVLGGTLDVESRWRVMTLQALARSLEGKTVHVRTRNQEATSKFEDRLAPNRLQDLVWLLGLQEQVNALEKSGALEGQIAKEMRDTLGQELDTPDLKNKVKSRARRLGLLEQLPTEADPLRDEEPIRALNNTFQRLMNVSFDTTKLRTALEQGVATRATGRDFGEMLLLHTLATPLAIAQHATGTLLETIATIDDLDRLLLEAIADDSIGLSAEKAAERVGDVTAEWVNARLREWKLTDASAAAAKLASLSENEIEINEVQVARALGDANMGINWIRERLRGWELVRNERAYDAPEELQNELGDSAIVHFRFNRAAATNLLAQWNGDAAHRREMTMVEAPNLVLLGDMAQQIGQQAPFLEPEWLHHVLAGLGIVGENDVFQAQMLGQVEDEQGNIQTVPVDVLVYRIALPRVLGALQPTMREARATGARDAAAVYNYVLQQMPWTEQFIDEAWIAEHLDDVAAPVVTAPNQAAVLIETGVAGQSADIVLESEPRPEDIAHTSEQEEVKALGGLHIIGTERHESRRIDNQLRGRAGRQGDPGSSRFYVSLEDELWRLFGVRGQWLLNKWDEDEPVEAGMISKSIERAQKKVELNHFEGRKHVLQYDDVMNVQRETIYRERRRALMGDDLRDTVLDMAQQAAIAEAEKHCPHDVRSEEYDTRKLYAGLTRLFGANMVNKHIKLDDLEGLRWTELSGDAIGQKTYDIALVDGRSLREIVEALYAEREAALTEDYARNLERWLVTRNIDDYWMEHLAEMDYLRDAIWQEGYAQKEPIGVYRQEAFALFQKMLGEIRREVTEQLFSMPIEAQQPQPVYDGPQMLDLHEARLMTALPMDEDGFDDGVQLSKDADGDDEDEPELVASPVGRPAPQTRGAAVAAPRSATAGTPSAIGNDGPRVGRNDPCPCGSGKKYKKCCLPKEQGVTV